jgi:hypothetical protein
MIKIQKFLVGVLIDLDSSALEISIRNKPSSVEAYPVLICHSQDSVFMVYL